MTRHRVKLAVATALVIATTSTAWGLSPEDKCEADKNKEAGKYAFCRAKAEAKAIKKGTVPEYTKCDDKLLGKWAKAEQKAIKKGASCIDSVTDTAIQSFVTTQSDIVAAALDGGGLPDCGDDSINVAGEQCDGIDLGGEDCTTLGFSSGTLACDVSCGFDTSGCDAGGSAFPASGQTTSYGPGSDGNVQAGAALSYTDNGDGTITDNNSGLMWEKKDDSGGIHDKDNAYTWCGASCGGAYEMDGTIKTVFLDTLNDVAGGGTSCLAGYCDWRVPNAKELQSIIDYDEFSPSVDPAFHQAGTCTGCADVTLASCSCSGLQWYWSSTFSTGFPGRAWQVDFGSGILAPDTATSPRTVRAVRGGS